MKMKTLVLLVGIMVISIACRTQQPVNVQAANPEISDNLDLEAVATAFGDARDLQEFEKLLNDKDLRISNLDLNEDGYVDYLRVIESTDGNTHLVTIQAALGNHIFQDVASIDVERDNSSSTYVQIIGNPYFYGPNYIINPLYYRTPYIIDWFWSPFYSPWISPYYWSYYPSYYSPWRPLPVPRYINNVHRSINVKNTYRYTTVRRSMNAPALQTKNSRNDYSRTRAENAFESRNRDVINKAELDNNRNSQAAPAGRTERTSTPRSDTRTETNRQKTDANRAKTANPQPTRKPVNANPRPESKSRPSGSKPATNSAPVQRKSSRGSGNLD